ncbi:endonuclease/exonuclease/phosphatase family protein [Fusobacterium sp. MFO224]|uniref:endonuclease/exonuclease/phosphatase family protein n=1 Tax=Fusobacterium sp. MFO224 TaxID=3378070 RepID=UPI003851D050
MKLMTLNCHSWQEDNQRDKIKYLAKVIVKENYDIIALQEVSQLKSSNKIKGNIREDNFIYILLWELEKLERTYDYRWDFNHIGYDLYEEGIGIIFRGNVKEKDGDFIGKTKDTNFWKTRKFSRVSIEINNEIIDFYSCHMGWWQDEENSFEEQVEDLLRITKERGNRYFLMGDFNNDAKVREEGYDYLIGKELIDTYNIAEKKDSGITVKGVIAGWEGRNSKDKRIDLILTNNICKVKESLVIFNGENYEKISDHFGVSVEVD